MTHKTRHGARDDAAWLPAWRLSEAGWATDRIAQIMHVTPRWTATRIRRIARLTEDERAALQAIALARIAREAEALAMLGRTAEAKDALARLDLAEKAAARREAAAARTPAPDAARRPGARREEGEYAHVSTEELRAQLRQDLERQAARFGFTEELEQAFREGEARSAAERAREDGRADPAEAPATAPALAEPAPPLPAAPPSAPPDAIQTHGAGDTRRPSGVAGPSVRYL